MLLFVASRHDVIALKYLNGYHPSKWMPATPLSSGFHGHLTLVSALLIRGLHQGWQLWLPVSNCIDAEVFDCMNHAASGQGGTLSRIWTGLHHHRDILFICTYIQSIAQHYPYAYLSTEYQPAQESFTICIFQLCIYNQNGFLGCDMK